MKLLDRIIRHARITSRNYQKRPTPPFLILFINSICNQKCEHCFYWRNLNRKDDLTKDELFALSRSLGEFETLNLSGGEPFLRAEFAEICRQFIQHNKVRQIYVPTNASFADRVVKQVSATLEEKDLELFAVEISLDGYGEFHDRFRGMPGAFQRAIATYDALAELQQKDPRLRIHSISTATAENLDEIRRLTTFLFERCPKMDHHNLALIRGDRKNPSLQGPQLDAYMDLYHYIQRLWMTREEGRYGSMVEPMLQIAKVKTAQARRQVIPCRAGIISGVVYANGDVSLCETHPPIGNLRQKTFWEIWDSPEAHQLRASIAQKQCYCTQEIALWTSFHFQPTQLVKLMVQANLRPKLKPLRPEERVPVPADFFPDQPEDKPVVIKSLGAKV